MSLGKARANGAISVVNAIATGKGASLAIALETIATVELVEESPAVTVRILPDKEEDPSLAEEVVREVLIRLGEPMLGARVVTESTIPVSRGLKSSSAAANAIALATSSAYQKYHGTALSDKQCLDAAVTAALRAGVTITGAFDDASASMTGGLCVTDNRDRKLHHRIAIEDDVVAVIHVPPAKTRKSSVRDLPYAAIARVAERAWGLALRGEWAEAMTLNGLAFGPLYGVDPQPALRALAAGALGASVSGTGPAIAAVARREDAEQVRHAFETLAGEVITVDVTARRAEVIPC